MPPRSVVKRRMLALLADVELMHKRSVRPGALSGGEQQQLAIARALANEPFVLLADEPTANLDPETTDLVMQTLAEVQARGTTVLMATHNEALVSRHRRRVLLLEDGRISGALRLQAVRHERQKALLNVKRKTEDRLAIRVRRRESELKRLRVDADAGAEAVRKTKAAMAASSEKSQ